MRFLSLHLLPWVAAGLAVVVIIVCLAAWRRRRAIRALSAAGGMVSNASPRRRIIRTAALLAACGLAAVAVLRPITGTILTDHSMPAKHLVVLLDVSKSMAAVDVNGLSRLEAAKLAIRELLNERAADQIGLVVFSGEAFVECPITRSRSIFINRLELAQPGMLPADGTSLAGGLRRALDLLGEHPPKGASILLFSDGDNVSGDPLADLGEVQQRQVSVHTVAFGTPGVPAPLPAGLSRNPSATSAADPSLLADIATRTGGAAFAGDPAHLDATLARMMPAIDAVNVGGSDMAREFRERPIDAYAWPLGLAVGCLMLRFFLPLRTRQWHPLAAVAVMFMACSITSPAADVKPVAIYESALESARAAQKPLVLAFTGSDWSDVSIRMEREILSHEVYRTWAERSVSVLPIDMPRHALAEDVRRQNRELVKQHHVTTYPTFVFIDAKDGKEMGRLGYDASGPASWVDRANAILRGDRSVSDSERSITKLPAETRAWLEDAAIPAGERCTRYYNEALTLEGSASGKSTVSKDRFALLEEILANANQLAGSNAELAFAPRMKLATLRHQQGLTRDPKRKPADTVAMLEKAQLEYHSAAAMAPADDANLSHNLALIARDIEHARLVLACSKAYQRATKLVELGNTIEQTFHQDLDNWITTATPVNDRRIEEARDAIDALVVAADASGDTNKEKFRQAAEEIRNCPAPHGARALQASAEVFQKVHDLLIPPQSQSQQQEPGEGQGEGQGDGDEDEEKESTEPKQGAESPKGNADRNLSEQEENSALRSAAEKNRGLRDQQLKELGRKAKPVPPEQDR